MDVILLEKIANLGNLGDKVNVKSGYGRNYLLPQRKATAATAANIAEFEARRADLEKAAAERKASAETRAAQLAELDGKRDPALAKLKTRWDFLKVALEDMNSGSNNFTTASGRPFAPIMVDRHARSLSDQWMAAKP